MSLNNIQDELKDLNSNLPEKVNPYTVPQGYFEGLAASVLGKVKDNTISAQDEVGKIAPLLATISRQMPFEIPENYFQSNLEALPYMISQEDFSNSMATSAMPYEVPTGYFAALPQAILKKVAPQKGRIISIKAHWKTFAAAAIITGIIALSGISHLFYNPFKDPIAQVRKASNSEIEAFLTSTGNHLSHNATAQNSLRKTEVQRMMQNFTDSEVDAFLKQVPEEESITN